MNGLGVSARMTVRSGQLDGFKEQAVEFIIQIRERDTKTLRYGWFLSEYETGREVREACQSADPSG